MHEGAPGVRCVREEKCDELRQEGKKPFHILFFRFLFYMINAGTDHYTSKAISAEAIKKQVLNFL